MTALSPSPLPPPLLRRLPAVLFTSKRTLLNVLVFILLFSRVVEFASKEDMKNALKKLDDTELNGRRIRLKIVSEYSAVQTFAFAC